MLFKDLFKDIITEDIIKAILEVHPEEINNILSYSEMIAKLQKLTPTESKLKLGVVPRLDYFDKGIVDDVMGYDKEEENVYALDLTHWDEWLAMEVSQKSLEHYGKEKFIAHCLYEMSFISFDETKIDELLEDLKEVEKEIEDGTIQYKSSEDVFSELGIEIPTPTEEEIKQRREEMTEIKTKNDAIVLEFFK